MKILTSDAPGADGIFRAASLLYRGGASAVWLFGSRASPRIPDSASDYDLAVEGLADLSRFEIPAARAIGGKVDLVRLETTNSFMRERIMKYRLFVPDREFPAASMRRPVLPASQQGARTSVGADLVRNSGATSLIDFGCGNGMLLAQLFDAERIVRLAGVDCSASVLEAARRRFRSTVGNGWADRIELMEGLVTWPDPRFAGWDAATAVEVIEHLEIPQLAAFENVLFGFAGPALAVVTSPNREYNIVWHGNASRRRHSDHRFEWNRGEFADWAKRCAARYHYDFEIRGAGSEHPVHGSSTQVAIFRRHGSTGAA